MIDDRALDHPANLLSSSRCEEIRFPTIFDHAKHLDQDGLAVARVPHGLFAAGEVSLPYHFLEDTVIAGYYMSKFHPAMSVISALGEMIVAHVI